MSEFGSNLSVTNPQNKEISHNKTRCFKPEKLTEPRDFSIPSFILNRSKAQDQGDGSSINEQAERALIVEIGAGKGMHACLYAKKNPEHDLIAIERTQNKFAAFTNLLQSVNNEVVKLDNLLAIHADAIPYCVHALPVNSVDIFYLLYPNPELKNPNQQWLNMPFFEFLLSRLKPNGKVILASNIEKYINNAYQQAVETWGLPTSKSMVPIESKRTHFEIKYLARGETCWELQMQKPEGYCTRFDAWNSEALKALGFTNPGIKKA